MLSSFWPMRVVSETLQANGFFGPAFARFFLTEVGISRNFFA